MVVLEIWLDLLWHQELIIIEHRVYNLIEQVYNHRRKNVVNEIEDRQEFIDFRFSVSK